MNARSNPPPALSKDLVGSMFLESIGGALVAAVGGSVFGYFVEAAADSSPAARLGALLTAVPLAACGAALAFAEGSSYGTREAVGRALREALSSSWRGLWLGGLMGGAFATGGGIGLLLAVLGAIVAGGLLGLLVGRLRRIVDLVPRLSLALSVALLGAFLVAAGWGTPGTPTLTQAGVAEAMQGSSAFGPSARWIWGTCASVPLVLAVLVWWLRSYREEMAQAKEPPLGLGWALAALIFTAALAVGLGVVVGAAAQWLTGQLVLGSALTPTPGKWIGAALALIFWGLKRQPDRSTSLVITKEWVLGAVSSLLQERQTMESAETAAVTEKLSLFDQPEALPSPER